ncbi:phytanoyl-CoA dioxygenase family protein [Natrialba aegyptia]|uniref:phytanoyl-CoA dioxygenase family protein n=1 Tax=Natrialba aegyptia TaxID=129789 RepID=UPI000A022D40|nr:phytanoyl-CoA dioxygenase family protein [Natrialba aegyptia]
MDTTQRVRKKFKRDGFVIVRDVLDKQTVEEGRQLAERIRKHNHEVDLENPNSIGDAQAVRHPFLADLVSDERILELVGAILDDIVHLQSTYFIKKPQSDNRTLWHQDGAYWTQFINPLQVISVWAAFDRTTPENGCMKFIPGSHKEGYLEHDISGVVSDGDKDDDEEVNLEEAGYDESDAVDIELKPGDISIHRPSILHASYRNTTDRWRRAYAIRYTSTSVNMLRPGQEGQKGAFLLRGEPSDPQQYRKLPLYDPDDDSQMHFTGWEAYNERARTLNDSLSPDNLMDV